MTPERYKKFKHLLDRRQPDLTVITDQVHKPHNLSAIIRTCDAVGIPDIHLSQPKMGYRNFCGRTVGSHKYVNVHHHSSVEEGISQLKASGFKVYAAHFSNTAIPYSEVDYTSPVAVMMGAEKKGISTEAAELADQHIIIPMQGIVASFNVSVAAAVILVEAQRQRLLKGMYDKPSLPPEIYPPTLFRWGYPELARYCDQRGLKYPQMDDNGQLIDPSSWYAQVRTDT